MDIINIINIGCVIFLVASGEIDLERLPGNCKQKKEKRTREKLFRRVSARSSSKHRFLIRCNKNVSAKRKRL